MKITEKLNIKTNNLQLEEYMKKVVEINGYDIKNIQGKFLPEILKDIIEKNFSMSGFVRMTGDNNVFFEFEFLTLANPNQVFTLCETIAIDELKKQYFPEQKYKDFFISSVESCPSNTKNYSAIRKQENLNFILKRYYQ